MNRNITNKVLKSNSYRGFLRWARNQRNFNMLPENRKRKINPFYKIPTPNLHQVTNSPNKKNGISHTPKLTPQKQHVTLGHTRVSLYTASPPRKVKRHLTSPNNNNTSKNLSKNFKKIRMNSPPRGTLTKQKTPTSPLEKGPFNSYKKGGVVRRTGLARVHKGELVIPRAQVAMVRRAIRMYKRRTARK